ncbi:hypothetical protein [Clostridium phage XP41-N3]|jgi:hypothetical protein|nr:hypothetical protein [Clostridium phage XP41-N3]
MNNNFNNDIDYLALFGTFLGVLNYMENIKQTSNDELLEELKKQDVLYLETIIKQNNEIIKLLKEGK